MTRNARIAWIGTAETVGGGVGNRMQAELAGFAGNLALFEQLQG